MPTKIRPNNVNDILLAINTGIIPSLGVIPGVRPKDVFGKATDVDSGVFSDIWDRANSSDAQDTYIIPTQARIHDIASSNAQDNISGTGARKVEITGLVDWDTPEVSETVELAGLSNAPTSNSYVILHSMRVIESGNTNINAGTLEATARTDGTVSAQIQPNEGKAQMAILGIPSSQIGLLTAYYASSIKSGASLSNELRLLVNEHPDTTPDVFVVEHATGIRTDGASRVIHDLKDHRRVEGPAIIKLQVDSSSNNTVVFGGFEIILIDN